jgi:hypothetical protein
MTWIKISAAIIVVVMLVIIGPLVTIWSLNTLFNLNIPYTFDTFIATTWLFSSLYMANRSSKNKK